MRLKIIIDLVSNEVLVGSRDYESLTYELDDDLTIDDMYEFVWDYLDQCLSFLRYRRTTSCDYCQHCIDCIDYHKIEDIDEIRLTSKPSTRRRLTIEADCR